MGESTTEDDHCCCPIKFNTSYFISCDFKGLECYLNQKVHFNKADSLRVKEDLRQVQLEQERTDVSAFHLAAEAGHLDIVHVLMSCIRPQISGVHDLISCYFESAVNDLFGFPFNLNALTYMLSSVSAEQRIQLLSRRYGLLETTIFHSAIIKRNHESIKVVYEAIGQYEFYQLLLIKNNWGRTPFHFACMSEGSESLEIILSKLQSDQCFSLVSMRDIGGLTPIQDIPAMNVQLMMGMIRNSLTLEQWIDVLMLPLPTDHKDQIYAESIMDNRRSECQDKIRSLMEHEPLTWKSLQELSTCSLQYVIPYNQRHLKSYGLVLFNSKDRQGAVSEAEKFEQGLQALGCETEQMEWNDGQELREMIQCHVKRSRGSCAFMMVGIMCHGCRGGLLGNRGEVVPINDVMRIFQNLLSDDIPLAMTIQACQAPVQRLPQQLIGKVDPAITEPYFENTPEKNRQRDFYIVMERQNTVLLLATVFGGTAIRGAFTGALAEEFFEADGVRNINTIFNRAVSRMKRKDPACVTQTAELRATTDKDLILPRANLQRTDSEESIVCEDNAEF